MACCLAAVTHVAASGVRGGQHSCCNAWALQLGICGMQFCLYRDMCCVAWVMTSVAQFSIRAIRSVSPKAQCSYSIESKYHAAAFCVVRAMLQRRYGLRYDVLPSSECALCAVSAAVHHSHTYMQTYPLARHNAGICQNKHVRNVVAVIAAMVPGQIMQIISGWH